MKNNILIACEESQRVCTEFRKLGFNAYSCDIIECSGGYPEWHFQQDIFEVLKNKGGITQGGENIKVEKWKSGKVEKWNLMVAHPPCTFLAVSGAKWYYHPDDKDLPIEKRRPHPKFPNRLKHKGEAIDFF